MSKLKVSIVGGSGYVGGELLRILLSHPYLEIAQITSLEYYSKPVILLNPNLRGKTDLVFCKIDELKECDILIVALPNTKSMEFMRDFMKISPKIIDLGADFRLPSIKVWEEWYHTPHLAPDLLSQFIYGVPEIKRQEIKNAKYLACPGCEAIVSILCLWPLVKHNLIEERVIIDAKMPSSAGGSKPSFASHHPERSRVLRSYSPTGHRHIPEIEGFLSDSGNKIRVYISATATENVRGILVTIQTFLKKDCPEKEIWEIFRQEYGKEPFIRIVKTKEGIYRYPEPKILQGTNFCDIGFEKEENTNRMVIIGAIDNLVKGSAGNAVQCLNLMEGFEETTALEFSGLHPI